MSACSRKQTIQTTIETRDYDSSAPLNEFDLAPLTLVLRNVQGLERRPLVVLRQDVQTASVVRVGARHAKWHTRPSLQLTRPTAGPTGCASTTVRDTGGPRMDAPRRSDPSRVHRRIRHGSPRAEATRRASITYVTRRALNCACQTGRTPRASTAALDKAHARRWTQDAQSSTAHERQAAVARPTARTATIVHDTEGPSAKRRTS